MKTKNLLLITAIVVGLGSILTSCSKKEGCTDITAENYNVDADKDDGSCLYAETPLPSGSNIVTITDVGSGTGTTTWTNDKVYLLDGFVFVNLGQTLTIEAGTIIKGKPGTGASASALIVAKGATINAIGTATSPIIFTFEADPLDGSVPLTTTGQWGGIIILGDAVLNTVPTTQNIEGIPTSEPRGAYGGSNDSDNSGTMKYVSIRHGGTDIGAGNEINGLTLGGVGSGTTIEYIEVVANADDGIEFFGGTPNLKHILVSNVLDDSYDYDQGFRGKGQFWVAIENANSDRGGEHDGGTSPEDGTPYATPVIYNATYIGNGTSRAITFRDNAGGEYHNTVFHNFGKGIDIEDLASGEDSKARLDAGQLKLAGIVLSNIGSNNIVDNNGIGLSGHASISNISTTAAGISATNPVPGSSLGSGIASGDTWYDNVTYIGAFSGTNWAQGWTLTFP
ncbi:MAG: hypothetical protein JKX68_06715 [Flavobacteriales bacterium]|nr:hypothetical protein [Flavobacteriales bacterium]